MGSVGYLFYHKSKSELQSSMIEKLEIINSLKIDKVSDELEKYQEAIEEVQLISSKYQNMASIVNDSADAESVRYLKIRNQLESIRQAYGFSRLYIVSLESELIYPNKLLWNQREQQIIDEHLDECKKQKIYFQQLSSSVFRRNENSDETFFAITNPLYNDLEILNSILIIEIPMTSINKVIGEKAGLGESGQSLLVKNGCSAIKIMSSSTYEVFDTNFATLSKDKASPYPITKIFRSQDDKPSHHLLKVKTFDGYTSDLVWQRIPKSNWALMTKINHYESFEAVSNLKIVIISLGIGILFFTIVLISLFVNQILAPIKNISDNMAALSMGKFPSPISYPYQDEIKEATIALNSLIKRLRRATIVAEKLGSGEKELMERLRIKETDVLSTSLLKLKNKLQALEKEKEKSTWFSEGLAIHSETMHKSTSDIFLFGHNLISQLSSYINVQAGSIFALDNSEGDKKFHLIGSYAIDTNQAPTTILPGQGLVGQAGKDGKLIYVDRAPSDYLNITSGLGETETIKLLIVPLKVGKDVVGILEFASVLPIDLYKIDFVERLSENIAYSIKVIQHIDE